MMLRFLDPGPGGEKPRDLARVSASWRVWFLRNGEEIVNWNTGEEFVLDESSVMVALELALKEMEAGGRACLRVAEAWGAGALTPVGVGGACLKGAAVWVELRLHKVTNEMAPGEHSCVEEALRFALEKKEQGNRALAGGSGAEDNRALRRYEAGIHVLEALLPKQTGTSSSSSSTGAGKASAPGRQAAKLPAGPLASGEEEVARVGDALNALQLNSAQAELRRNKWRKAVEFCDVVLRRTDGKNAKARYRRGIARVELGEFSGAVEDLRAAVLASPSDAGIRRELVRVEALYKEHKASEKSAFGGVFDKMRQKEKDREEKEEAQRKLEAKLEKEKKEQEQARLKKEAEERYEKQQERLKNEAAEADAKVAEEKEAQQQQRQENEGAKKVEATPAAAPSDGTTGAAKGPPAAQPAPAAAKPLVQTTGTWALQPEAPAPTRDSGQEEVDAKADEILKSLQQKNPGLRRLKEMQTVQESPPVEYEVPSFLRGAKKKKKPAQ